MKPIKDIDDPRYVKAMSHPVRVRILAMLGERTASPSQLAGWLHASLGATAYHVRTLHKLGLIELADETRVRGAIEHHYRARERPMVTSEAWEKAPPISKQAAVGSSLQMIDEYARISAGAGGFDRPQAHLSRTLVRLDARSWEQLNRACLKFVDQVEKLEQAARERMERMPHEEEPSEVAVVLMAFEAARLSGADEHPAPAGHRRGAVRPPAARRAG